MMRKNINKYQPKYHKLSDVDSRFGTICSNCSQTARFFCDLYFGISKRHPLHQLWAPWGTLGPIFVVVWKSLEANALLMSKITRQYFDAL